MAGIQIFLGEVTHWFWRKWNSRSLADYTFDQIENMTRKTRQTYNVCWPYQRTTTDHTENQNESICPQLCRRQLISQNSECFKDAVKPICQERNSIQTFVTNSVEGHSKQRAMCNQARSRMRHLKGVCHNINMIECWLSVTGLHYEIHGHKTRRSLERGARRGWVNKQASE